MPITSQGRIVSAGVFAPLTTDLGLRLLSTWATLTRGNYLTTNFGGSWADSNSLPFPEVGYSHLLEPSSLNFRTHIRSVYIHSLDSNQD